MGRYSSDTGGGDFKPAAAGVHVSRCVKLIDLGTHHGEWQGNLVVRNQVYIGFELPLETLQTDKGDQPQVVGEFFTNSLSEKSKLRPMLESWRGRPFTDEELKKFDLMAILGKPCMVNVLHKKKNDGKTRASISAITGLPKGTECPPQVNSSFSFWIDEWDETKFQGLSDGFKKMIQDSDEFKAMLGKQDEPDVPWSDAPPADDGDEGPPF